MLYVCDQKKIIEIVFHVFFIIILFLIDGPIYIVHFTELKTAKPKENNKIYNNPFWR